MLGGLRHWRFSPFDSCPSPNNLGMLPPGGSGIVVSATWFQFCWDWRKHALLFKMVKFKVPWRPFGLAKWAEDLGSNSASVRVWVGSRKCSWILMQIQRTRHGCAHFCSLSFSRWGNQGSESSNNLPTGTKQISVQIYGSALPLRMCLIVTVGPFSPLRMWPSASPAY